MKLRHRLPIGAIAIAIMAVIYWSAAHITGLGTQVSLLTDIDKLIPFVPSAIWVYVSYLPLMISAFWLAEKRELFYHVTFGLILTTFLASIVYIVFPAFYPRTPVTCMDATSCMIYVVQYIDPANNTFPSLHCALSFLIAMFFYRDRGPYGALFALWALAIAVSTVLVKQHFIIDVFLGYILARMSRFMVLAGNKRFFKIQE